METWKYQGILILLFPGLKMHRENTTTTTSSSTIVVFNNNNNSLYKNND